MITRLQLSNWKNFRSVEFSIQRRLFIVGPNASGKSNLLDAFRFLRDLAEPQGGLQVAVEERRGSMAAIRSLHARTKPTVSIRVDVSLSSTDFRYELALDQPKSNGTHPTVRVKKEQVVVGGKLVVDRPDAADRGDPSRLTQTALEQMSANASFRALAEYFAGIQYLHIVPQVVRARGAMQFDRQMKSFGGDLIERMMELPPRIRTGRLRRVNKALASALPQLKRLKVEQDRRGIPHLRGLYKHWRPEAGWQSEEQFSDGTLRLIGLLWALLDDGDAPLLLEEPESHLHARIIRLVPQMMTRVIGEKPRQIFVSTHSTEMFNDPGIAPDEILLLVPGKEDTEARLGSTLAEITNLLSRGASIGRYIEGFTAPKSLRQLLLFDNEP